MAFLILLFEVVTFDDIAPNWGIFGVAIGLAIGAAQFVNRGWVRINALMFGVLLVAQAFIHPSTYDPNFITLPPNTTLDLDVGTWIRGIAHEQHVSTDAHGFRVTKPVDYLARAPLRIFAIGGSTTEQIWLDDHKTFTHLLQTRLESDLDKPIEVVNTGVSSLRAVNHLATFKAVQKFHPDLVIFLFGANDWNRHIRFHFSAFNPLRSDRALLVWQEPYRLRVTPVGRLLLRLRALVSNQSAALAARRTLREDPYGPYRNSLARPVKNEFRPTRVLDRYAADVRNLMEACRDAHLPCIFVTQPSGYQAGASDEYKRSFWLTPQYTPYTLTFESMVHIAKLYNEHLAIEARRHGFDVCDVAATIEPSFDNFYDDAHFNETGARHVADLLSQCVLRRLARPENPAAS
jgi:lysophospholipase L1-like esterase